MRPNPNHESEMGPIGATGIEARVYKGVKVTVEEVHPDTPAFGKFSKGDVILGVNGAMLQGKNPLVLLGNALTEAEAKDGILTFDVEPATAGKPKQVTVKVPVLGAYSPTFPLNCAKSKIIVRRAAEFYSGKDRMKKHGFLNGLACLFLLSTGDDQYVPRVKEYFSQFLNADGSVTGIADMTWDNGYNGIACAEYYLRTGDRSVLPILQHYCDDAKRRQIYNVGWTHWGTDISPSYEAGGGMLHSAGNQVLLTLVLGKVCGANVDEKTLLGALTHWYRFAGRGAIPVADQRSMVHLPVRRSRRGERSRDARCQWCQGRHHDLSESQGGVRLFLAHQLAVQRICLGGLLGKPDRRLHARVRCGIVPPEAASFPLDV